MAGTTDHPASLPAATLVGSVRIVRNVYVPLTDEVLERLRAMAQREYRDTRAQAAWLILEGLRKAAPDAVVRSAADRAAKR